jgi:hypothetical protein
MERLFHRMVGRRFPLLREREGETGAYVAETGENPLADAWLGAGARAAAEAMLAGTRE